MTVILCCDKKGLICYKTFNTITKAYHYYLKHFSTKRDWLYYLKHSHRLLSKVKDESVMKDIFDNVFFNACIIINKEID